ncbi:inositol monophosphatase family protein [Streptomyces sp. NPDC023998]|uniref:inositol monophosphatase family protein n=1 Tax=Streptomyces sp. NPDC023998 TaxID=3154597 RepID=UPI0033C1C56C
MADTLRKIDEGLAEVLDFIGVEIRRRVRELDGLHSLRVREDGDVTHDFDRFSESRILQFFESCNLGARFDSEESAPIDLGRDQDFTIIVDPLDGSSMLARGYPLASIAVSVIHREGGRPILSRILDVFTDVQYSVIGDIATRNGRKASPSTVTDLSRAFLVTYSATSERLRSDTFRRICETPPGLTLNYGGPLDIAKVGAGQCDLMLELQKGFSPRDYVAGLHFAQVAGAIAMQPGGAPVPYTSEEGRRVKFIVAANEHLLYSAIQDFGGDSA